MSPVLGKWEKRVGIRHRPVSDPQGTGQSPRCLKSLWKIRQNSVSFGNSDQGLGDKTRSSVFNSQLKKKGEEYE